MTAPHQKLAGQESTIIKGVVMVLTTPDGHVIAHAVDFDNSGYGGFTLFEAQRLRTRDALARNYVAAVSHPDMAKAIETYDAKNIVANLCRHHGYSLTEIPIGHTPDEAA